MTPQIWIWAFPVVLLLTGGWMLFHRRRLRGRRLYHEELERALADGILTEDEERELESVRERRDLSDQEVRMVAVSLYRRALRDAISDARITEAEDETLQRMRAQLGLSDKDLADDVKQLQRVGVLAGVERGELPKMHPPLDLADGEVAHWAVHARLADKLIVPGRRTYLRAVDLEVPGNAPFAATGERSVLATSTEILPIDTGLLVVTSRRTIFEGARKSLSVPHMKVQAIALYQDSVALDETDPPNTSFFLVPDPELTAAILLCAARKRQNELKSLTTRSA
jgi:hypothetical protein